MIKQSAKQRILPGFDNPFGLELNPENRWVRLSQIVPWAELGEIYESRLSSGRGRPAKPSRVVIGALIVKHLLKLTDEETVELIREHPYLQYFLGYPSFRDEAPFAPSLFVEIRRRMGEADFTRFEQAVIGSLKDRQSRERSDDAEQDPPTHKGKLRIDATVIEQGIRYPTDERLLNEAREASEQIIDELYPHTPLQKKPRTYRRKARKQWLSYSKKRRKSPQAGRRMRKAQLQYLRRNLGHIERMLDLAGSGEMPLSAKSQKKYWIIQQIYAQQKQMYESGQRRCPDRIVSLSQPQVRPMVRGKAGKAVEFGVKIGVSLDEAGVPCVDRMSWDAYHESEDLRMQVEAYRKRHGYWPEEVLADRAYGTRENRQWLKSKGIRYGGVPLGRPPADEQKRRERRRQQRKDARERNPIEGVIGESKVGYGLRRVETKTAKTTEGFIRTAFMVIAIKRLARRAVRWIRAAWQRPIEREIARVLQMTAPALPDYPRLIAA